MGFIEEDEMRDERGRLKPGHSGLKPKGANSKLPQEIKAKITEFLSGQLETVDEIYSQVSPKDKLKFLTELMAYVLPKSKEIFIDDSKDDANISLDDWSDEDLRTLIDLKKKYNIPNEA